MAGVVERSVGNDSDIELSVRSDPAFGDGEPPFDADAPCPRPSEFPAFGPHAMYSDQ